MIENIVISFSAMLSYLFKKRIEEDVKNYKGKIILFLFLLSLMFFPIFPFSFPIILGLLIAMKHEETFYSLFPYVLFLVNVFKNEYFLYFAIAYTIFVFWLK